MINTKRCILCQAINFKTIVESGITLPLRPYLTAWQNEPDLKTSCGLCTLLHLCLHLKLSERLDTLSFRYNIHFQVVVVAATTESFVQESILPKLLCGQYGEQWFFETYKYRSNFVCAFLSVNLGFGMYTTDIEIMFSDYAYKGEPSNDLISRRLSSSNSGSEECLRIAKWEICQTST
jgi:hypothetical protein